MVRLQPPPLFLRAHQARTHSMRKAVDLWLVVRLISFVMAQEPRATARGAQASFGLVRLCTDVILESQCLM